MPTLKEELAKITWADSDSQWKDRLRASPRCAGDEIEYAVFVKPGFDYVNADAISPDGINRFLGETESSLAQLASSSAGEYSHPYTSALILDYGQDSYKKSRQGKDATREAIDQYIAAVDWFVQQEQPGDYVISIADSVARAVDLALKYNSDIADLVAAVERAVGAFAGTNKERFIGPLVLAACRRMQSKKSPSLLSLYKATKAAIESITDGIARSQCAIDIDRLGKISGEYAGYKEWLAGLVGQFCLDTAATTDPTLLAYRLQNTLRLAVDTGHPIRTKLLEEFDRLKPALQNVGTEHQLAEFRFSIDDAKKIATEIAEEKSLESRMRIFSGISRMPTSAERKKLESALHLGDLPSLVSFVPIGEHGPTTDDADSLAEHQALSFLLLVQGAYISTVCEEMRTDKVFPPMAVAGAFRQAGLIEDGQDTLLADVWSAWTEGKYGLALFGLFPFVEQVYRQASCSPGIVRGRSGDLVLPVGKSLVSHVGTKFNNDVASVFEHLVAKEHAVRHGFAHGYQRYSNELKPWSAYCVFLLCFAYTRITEKST